MPTLVFRLRKPTQGQLQNMAGPGVNIDTVEWPEVPDVQITTSDTSEGYDSRLADGLDPFGWFLVGEV